MSGCRTSGAAGSACEGCGKCCHAEVPVTLHDIRRLAGHLGLEAREVFEAYAQRRVSSTSGLLMIRKRADHACVFLDEHVRCQVHAAKPGACTLYICGVAGVACHGEASCAALWQQSVASALTRAYLQRNGAAWVEGDYERVLSNIDDNVVVRESQTLRLARDGQDNVLVELYDCSRCEGRGTHAKETPITLDDIRRIAGEPGASWQGFFCERLDPQPASAAGGLRLRRRRRCTFFDEQVRCTLRSARPMHCRFTPCPLRTPSSEAYDCLFLGAGTPAEQHRHQVALGVSRSYVSQYGVRYSEAAVRRSLAQIDRLAADPAKFEAFCKLVAPYRYINDVPTPGQGGFIKPPEKGSGSPK